MFRTPVDGFFPTFQGLKILVRVIEGGNHIENHLKGNENWFELEGVRVIKGSSYRGQIKITENV